MSEAAISPALSRALRAGRAQFNARVEAACRQRPGFDTTVADALITGPLDKLATAAEALDADRTGSLLLAAFDAGITLALHGKHEHPLVRTVWREVLPACLPLMLRQPRKTLGKLFNAALHLLSTGGVRTEQWAQDMARVALRCDNLSHLEQIGQILAWRAGMAHFRESALKLARGLPPELAVDALALLPEQDVAAVLDRLDADPWFDPAHDSSHGLRAMHEVGSFTGFGGPFAAPPEVRGHGEGFVVRCADRHWYLCADVFGAVLHADSPEEYAAGASRADGLEVKGGEIRLGQRRCALDLPPEGVRVVRNASTAAVTSPHSHTIRLFALT